MDAHHQVSDNSVVLHDEGNTTPMMHQLYETV